MGALQVVRQLGSNAHDQALAMRVTSNGVVVLVGYTAGVLPAQASEGGNDAFIVRFGDL